MLNEIKIMGIPFKIVEKAVVCKGESGITRGAIDFSNDTIEIDEELSAERKEQVIIHEVIHAIFDLIGDEELTKDERTVQSLSAALYCVIKENNLFSLLWCLLR